MHLYCSQYDFSKRVKRLGWDCLLCRSNLLVMGLLALPFQFASDPWIGSRVRISQLGNQATPFHVLARRCHSMAQSAWATQTILLLMFRESCLQYIFFIIWQIISFIICATSSKATIIFLCESRHWKVQQTFWNRREWSSRAIQTIKVCMQMLETWL